MAQRFARATQRRRLLESLTRTFVVEQAAYGITCNAVAPGPTETELFRRNNPRGRVGESRYLAQVPLGRLGAPAEIAATITFLASTGAGYLTAQTLTVDGGASLNAAVPSTKRTMNRTRPMPVSGRNGH